MGKIHEALRRAEEERGRVGALPDADALLSSRVLRRPERIEHVRDLRRSLSVMAGAESEISEEYRTLRARIQSLRKQRPIRSLVVTSALPGEGKTTTALNLALSFGLEREGRTCLLDADLRTSSIQTGLLEEPKVGLAELLEADEKLEDALIHVPDTRLSVLTVKRLPARPSELLASVRMKDLLAELQSRFELVVVDSPPVLGLPDATTLVDLCDAVLLVVGNGISGQAEVQEMLGRIDARKAIGCVFNRSDEKPRTYGTKYGGSAS